jgi:adenylate cyclase
VLVVLLKKTARLTVITSTVVENAQRDLKQSAQQKDQQSQIEETLKQYKDKSEEAMLLSQTLNKFVPKQSVDHFAKHDSDWLELGRADEDELAVLFSDIRGFTGLSEQMKQQQLINFLNSYLRMNEPINENKGFIDKFIGDAVMA